MTSLAVAASICWGVGAVAVAQFATSVRVTSYFASAPALLVLGAVAGLGLITVGVLSSLAARRGAIGTLALLAGVAWLAPAWVGWEYGPSPLRTLGLLLTPLLIPVLVHLSTLDERGRIASAWDRLLTVTAYAATAAVVLGHALVHDPLRDAACTVACRSGGNPLLAWSNQDLARILDSGLLLVTVTLGVLAVLRAAARVLPRRRMSRLGLLVTLPAAVALLGEVAFALVLLDARVERFDGSPGTAVFVLRSIALGALAVGIGWVTIWRLRAARRRLVSVAAEAGGAAPGEDLESQLARFLGDDTLEVLYRVPGSERLIDAAGREARIDPDDPRTAVPVTRGRQPVATLLHDPDRAISEDLELGLGGLARMVLDNERLRAAASAHLAELQASRARIVAAGDDLRRAVERDLHDGAQQRLLAAAYELRLAHMEIADPDVQVGQRLDLAVTTATAALGELRDFAHGVFPAVLDEAGLEAALFSLADDAAVLVELDVAGLDTVPVPAARATYLLVRTVVASASPGAVVEVSVVRKEDRMVVETSGGGPVDPVRLGDRVGAVGGEITVSGSTVRAVIPCGS